uniref:Putative chaperone n=1 Tax=viral metagenome TaxID=1070528 RepID=A0A6M3IDF1_9ZZZZ
MAGRISDVERAQRLHVIDQFNQEGKTDYEISKDLGISIDVVKRLQAYLENLQKANISPKELAEKRSELYLELTQASAEARKLFDEYKIPQVCPRCNGTTFYTKMSLKTEKEYKITCDVCKGLGEIQRSFEANKFFQSWLEAIEKKAKLYGLDNQRNDAILQQFNFLSDKYIPEMKIVGKARELSEKLADKLKQDHESRIRDNG